MCVSNAGVELRSQRPAASSQCQRRGAEGAQAVAARLTALPAKLRARAAPRSCGAGSAFRSLSVSLLSPAPCAPHSTYVNPHGVVSDLMTLLTVRNCALEGSPSEEFSWFPG